MSDLVQVRKKAQVTLPQSVRQELGIEEGDFLDIQVRSGEIVLKVKKLVDKTRHGSGRIAGNKAKKRLKKISALAGCIIFLMPNRP